MMKRNINKNDQSSDDSVISDDHISFEIESSNESQHKEDPLISDVKIFGAIFQIGIAGIFLGLITINILNINYYCRLFQDYNSFRSSSCILGKCHYYLMAISFGIINSITSLLIFYDYFQAKKRGYRLNDYFLYFMAWSGGWIPLLASLNYTDYRLFKKNAQTMFNLIIMFSIISITSPALYIILAY